jgi:hypothetical protein
MKETVEYLREKGIICKSFREVAPKVLGSRKRVRIFVGVNLEGYYCTLILIRKKSRVLRKEAQELIVLHEKLEAWQGTKIRLRYLHIDAPLCSKARVLLEESGWNIWHDS